MRILIIPTIVMVLFSVALSGCHKSVSAPPPVAAAPSPSPPPLPPTVSLNADRTTITSGETVTLTWRSTNAATVVLDNAIGNVATSGTRLVSPRTSTSYTAVAQGAGGTASSSAIRVTVNTPPLPARNEPIRAQPTRTATLAEQFETAMQNILFEYDQALIRTTEIPKLQSATQFLIANPSVQLIVEGNADERGSQEYNIALGDERAAVVKKYFVDHGVTSSRLDALSYGEERPLCRQETEGCWQRNRRAQFTMKP